MATRKAPVVDTALLTAALEGLEMQRARIEEQISEVRARLGRRGPAKAGTAAPAEKRSRRPLSDAARKRIAAAQKRRWANFRKQQGGGRKQSAPKKQAAES